MWVDPNQLPHILMVVIAAEDDIVFLFPKEVHKDGIYLTIFGKPDNTFYLLAVHSTEFAQNLGSFARPGKAAIGISAVTTPTV